MAWRKKPAYANAVTAKMRNKISLVKSNGESWIWVGLRIATALITMVEMNKAPPNNSPILISALLVRRIPLMDENTSGAPLANANKVTPAKLLPIFPFKEMEANVGEK